MSDFVHQIVKFKFLPIPCISIATNLTLWKQKCLLQNREKLGIREYERKSPFTKMILVMCTRSFVDCSLLVFYLYIY